MGAETKGRGATKRRRGPGRSDQMVAVPNGCDCLLSRKQVCYQLGVSLRTFQGMVNAGEFPAHDTLLGKRPRWWNHTLNEWIRGRCEPELE